MKLPQSLQFFFNEISLKGFLIFPYSTCLYLYNKKAPVVWEVFSDYDYISLLKKGFNGKFLAHEFWDIIFFIENNLVCYKKITSPDEIPYINKIHFFFDFKKESFIDRSNFLYNLKSSSLFLSFTSEYFYLKTLLLKKEFDLNVNISINIKNYTPHFIEWEIFKLLITGKNTYKIIREISNNKIIFSFFPILLHMTHTKHLKDYHPEGNAFEHTIECFKYLKNPDLTLSLGVLFHDIGKPFVKEKYKDKPFYNHSQIGANLIPKILTEKYFDKKTIDNVVFLVKYHMIPPYISKLPTQKATKIIYHSQFENLLKLFRADTLSTYTSDEMYKKILKSIKYFRKNIYALDKNLR